MRILIAILAILAGLLSESAAGAEIRFFPLSTSGTGVWTDDLPHILISGEITRADADRIKSLMPLLKNAEGKALTPVVLLDSTGGDVLEAIRIGAFLREEQAWTVVEKDASCASACVLILAAGVHRDVYGGARLGLHRPSFPS